MSKRTTGPPLAGSMPCITSASTPAARLPDHQPAFQRPALAAHTSAPPIPFSTQVAALVRECMEAAWPEPLRVPLRVRICEGPSWGELRERKAARAAAGSQGSQDSQGEGARDLLSGLESSDDDDIGEEG